MFDLVAHQGWEARFGQGNQMTAGPKEHVIVHHDGFDRSKVGMSIDDEAAIMRIFERFHADDLTEKNPRIAYSFVVMQTGRIYEGCGWTGIGAHTAGLNSSGYGYCFPLNGARTVPTKEAVNAFRWHIAEGVRLGHIAKDHKVSGHQEHGKPSCPGKLVYQAVVKNYTPWTDRVAPPKVGTIVWSDYFKDFLLIVRYKSDTDWSFVPVKSLAPGLKAQTPLSQMPLAPKES